MNSLDRWNEVPPCVMRLIAAKNGRALGANEIAKLSGLSKSTVQRVSIRRRWNGVRIDVAHRFASGCGYNLDSLAPAVKRLKYIEERGVSAMKHLNPPKSYPLWKKGAIGNTKKFLIRIITSDEQVNGGAKEGRDTAQQVAGVH